jgi:hypothetical protein
MGSDGREGQGRPRAWPLRVNRGRTYPVPFGLPVRRTSARLSALIAGQDDSYRSGQKSNSANAEISSGLLITGFCAFAARWRSIGVWGVKLLSFGFANPVDLKKDWS